MTCISRIFSVILFLGCFQLNAQINAFMSFESDSVEMGAPVDLLLFIESRGELNVESISLNGIDSIQFQSLFESPGAESEEATIDFNLESLGGFLDANEDLIISDDEMKWDTLKISDSQRLSNRLKFIFWDPGVAYIPPFEYIHSRGQTSQFIQGAAVFIKPPAELLNTPSDSLQLAPIKPIIREALKLSDFYLYLGIIALLLIAGLYFWWRKTKKKESPAEEITIEIPAHLIALEKLDQLDREKLWQKGEIKEYQTGLTFIIREYLENQFDISALESTTDEITQDLRSFGFSQEINQNLSQILQIADLVKFAKAEPDLDVHQKFLEDARHFVLSTKTISQEKEIENA